MLLSTLRRYTGRVIHVDQDTVRFPDGSIGELEMVRHPGASAVVPFLDDPTAADPRVVLLKQFRHAADDVIWEVPAGTLDAGELPEACAARELTEEAGYRAATIRHLTSVFTTPGFTDELIHLYLATGLTPEAERHEDDEFITATECRWSEVGRMVRRGEIRDAKTLCALFYVQAFVRG